MKLMKAALRASSAFAVLALVTHGASAAPPSRGANAKLSAPVPNDGKTYVAQRAITVDPVTKELRKPTAEEIRALVANLKSLTSRSTEGLRVVTRPNGTRQVNLQGRFQNVVVARPAADGTMETRCVTTFEEAADFLGLVPAESGAAAE
jgi:hypothetical protein